MGDYPNSDEEFELMYETELELLKEQEDKSEPKPKRCLDFNAPASEDNRQVDSDLDVIASQDNTNSNKRTIEELFGDIDDILSEGIAGSLPKKLKTDKGRSDLALIQHIVQLRELSKEHDVLGTVAKDYTTSKVDRDKYNLSSRVPKFPFIPVTRHNGERIYVRFHSEEYEKEDTKKIAASNSFTGVMGESFKEIWNEANAYINKELEVVPDTEISILEEPVAVDLWVDLYKPKKYLELLSDESTNRILLKWMKLWDKVVFNRRPKIKPVKVEETNFKFKKQDAVLKLDSDGRPEFKVALLCGPPGLGKTTLAHMVARHAGYNVVEINASDDRSVDNFKSALQNATSMRSVLDTERRPNCLVFDEIDGAPATSIDFLIKYVNGTQTSKSKKSSGGTLKRPIICICNDVYVPALRKLRQLAFVVDFPPTSSSRLADRLNEIARYQQIKTNLGVLLAMAEKSHNDIRSCLSVLQFFKSQNKPYITLSDVLKSSIGQKDMQKGLFSVWNDIFRIQRPKQKFTNDPEQSQGHCDVDLTSLKSRMQKVLHSVNSFGDYARLMEGVFENYPSMKTRDSSLVGTCEAIEWFCFNDTINKKVFAHQEYSLATYLQYGFVVWHFMFASFAWQKINYPSVGYEVRTKVTKQKALMAELIRGMQPSTRAFVHPSSLRLEILPLLLQIIVPSFRPVGLQMYTQEEKSLLIHVVSVMIDYNLSYMQERTSENNFVYNLDPNVEEIALFPYTKSKTSLSYANKQLISREIELEKMRRAESHKIKNQPQEEKNQKEAGGSKQEIPNHLQRLNPKAIKPKEPAVRKDFFGRVITTPVPEDSKTGPEFKNDIWYKYKEGYTNAVRRKIKVKDLK